MFFIFALVPQLMANEGNTQDFSMEEYINDETFNPSLVEGGEQLVIVWTSDDPYLAERMVLMYSHAAKRAGWFEEVILIVWGPSAKLVAENLPIRDKLTDMLADGVKIEACVVCARSYGVEVSLSDLGIEVKPMGLPLTGYIKSGASILTF